MGTRRAIAGRERATTPTLGARDDGRMPLEYLRNRGARKVTLEEMAALAPNAAHVARGHAAAPPHAPAAAVQSDDFEDDPFGFRDLGFDDTFLPDGAPDIVLANVMDEHREAGAKVAHASHSLRRCAHVVWCEHCGRHAATRLGSGLLNTCRGTATGAYPARIARLKEGRHPVSGMRLV